MQFLQFFSKTMCTRWYEGTTQGYPTAMEVYEKTFTPLLKHLATCYPKRETKMVAFIDDLTCAERLLKLCSWWKDLLNIGPKYEYFPKPSKAILIVERRYELKASEIFDNTNIKITSSGQRHLGAVIKSELY